MTSFRRPPKDKLPSEALDQLRTILDEYDCLRANTATTSPGNDAEIAKLRKSLDEQPATLWWSDMLLAELCLVDMLDADQLRATLSSWRRRLHEVASPAEYADYLTSAPDIVHEQNPERLKADLCNCMQIVYFWYGAYGVAARSRTEATYSLMRAAVAVLAFEVAIGLLLFVHWNAGALAFSAPTDWAIPIAWMLAASCAAVLGSVVSVQRRLQDPSVDVDPYYRYIQTNADWLGIAVVSPIFAAIFGAVMYGLLVSKLLATSVINIIDGTPVHLSDAATLLIFGFVAGFAEQLIPDALTRIAARALSAVSDGTASNGGSVTPQSSSASSVSSSSSSDGAASSSSSDGAASSSSNGSASCQPLIPQYRRALIPRFLALIRN